MLSKMPLPAGFHKLRNRHISQLCRHILKFQPFCYPVQQNPVDSRKNPTGNQSLGGQLPKFFVAL